jgi:hypothetical protein
MKISLLIISALLLTACADTASRLNEMNVGMTKGEVTQLLGDPKETKAVSGVEYMMYELRDAPGAAAQAGCGVAGIYTLGIAYAFDDCQYSDDLYFVRLINGEVDAYGRQGDFDSTKDPTINIKTN